MLPSLKSKMVRRAKDFARARGYEITPLWKLAGQPLALHLRALLATYDVDCVLDVGANLGQFHDLLREDVGWMGPVLSFEPVGKYVSHLQARSQGERNWHIFDYALGAASKRADIKVTRSPGLNSFLDPSRESCPEIWGATSITHTEEVRIETLDSVLDDLRSRYGFRRPYLKLDTQGFDLEVLRGAVGSLPGIPALQTEASVKPLYHGQPGFIETVQFLNAQGFELSGMFPVTRDVSFRLIEFDCAMVNRRFATSSAIP